MARAFRPSLYGPETDHRMSLELSRQRLIQATAAVGTFAVLLCGALTHGNSARRWQGITSAHLPKPRSIPFSLMMDPFMPYCANAAKDFPACHLSKLTSPEFLEDGEWFGFYSHDNHERMSFGLPMHNVRFRENSSIDNRRVHAAGMDGVGSFDLDGVVVPDGKVRLTKRYHRGPVWRWTGVVTPFGIVGTWG